VTKVALTNLEYLALKIETTPGLSARELLRALHVYRHGPHKRRGSSGNWGASYFVPSGKYRNVLWTDSAPEAWHQPDWADCLIRVRTKGMWTITALGHEVANRARQKLGLPVV